MGYNTHLEHFPQAHWYLVTLLHFSFAVIVNALNVLHTFGMLCRLQTFRNAESA